MLLEMEFKMEDNNQKKPLRILKLIIGIFLFGAFGWVYFMGIISPDFGPHFNAIYRGIGCGMLAPFYFTLVPTYTKKAFPDIRYSGAIVTVVSLILTGILLFITFPLQA